VEPRRGVVIEKLFSRKAQSAAAFLRSFFALLALPKVLNISGASEQRNYFSRKGAKKSLRNAAALCAYA
jgi:hypothetical protein